jgi:hypothetical protein
MSAPRFDQADLDRLRGPEVLRSIVAQRVELKREGKAWKGLCPFHTEKTPSFTVFNDDGRFRCFGCGAHGDVFEYVKLRDRVDFPRAVETVAAEYGIPFEKPGKKPNGGNRAHPDEAIWLPIVPPPPDTPRPEGRLFAGYSAVYEYCDPNDRILFYVCRREATAISRKQFHPLVYGSLDGKTGWHSKHPQSPKPLYGLNRLTACPDAPVLLCEGEKAANAAQALFPNYEYACLSWFGGAQAVGHADLTPLADRLVIIWPDNDAEGDAAAAQLAKRLPGARTLRVDDLPAGGDAADIRPEDPEKWLRDHLHPPPEAPPCRFPLTPFADISVSRSPAYLVRGIIPREGIIVVWGLPKCGKTFWIKDLVLHIALGREYRDHRVTQGRVVYLACEGDRGFGARIEAWRQQNAITATTIVPFWLLTTRLDLSSEYETLIADIRAQLGSYPVAAIVVDTLNRSISGSESSDADMGAYIRAADAIRETFRCAVIIIHHCGLDTSRPRGHTSLLGAADAQIAVKRDNAGNVIATVEYLKDGASGTEIASRLKVIDLGLDDDSESITSCAIEAVESASSIRPGAKAPPPSARAALDLLRNAIAEEGETPPASNHIPPKIRAVKIETWRRHCYAGLITEADNPEAKRKAFGRASRALQNAGLIGVWDCWVWLAE